jgi:hypothetical protein
MGRYAASIPSCLTNINATSPFCTLVGLMFPLFLSPLSSENGASVCSTLAVRRFSKRIRELKRDALIRRRVCRIALIIARGGTFGGGDGAWIVSIFLPPAEGDDDVDLCLASICLGITKVKDREEFLSRCLICNSPIFPYEVVLLIVVRPVPRIFHLVSASRTQDAF